VASKETKMNSLERLEKTLNFERPDRVLTYDIISSYPIYNELAGEEIDPLRRAVKVHKLLGVDCTRAFIDSCNPEENHWIKQKIRTWEKYFGLKKRTVKAKKGSCTYWISARPFNDLRGLEKHMLQFPDPEEVRMDYVSQFKKIRDAFAEEDIVFVGATEGCLTDAYMFTGYELFMEGMFDAPELIKHLLDITTKWSRIITEAYADFRLGPVFFYCEDVACKHRLIFSPQWLKDHVIWRARKIIEPLKKRGVKQVFHSDGDISLIIDDLIEAGFDGINPIEPTAGMDIYAVREQYPRLLLFGNIDSSQLLPFSPVEKIENEVKRLIRGVAVSHGIGIGSSTEIHNAIPLKHARAMYDTIKHYGKYPISF
jgi:uroporphyrinogen-III decarboxylase